MKKYIAFTSSSHAISNTKEKALQELKSYLKRNKILPSVNKVGIADITDLPDGAGFDYMTWKLTGFIDGKKFDYPVKVIQVDWNKKNEIVTESKKINITELKSLVKKIIKEEESQYMKIPTIEEKDFKINRIIETEDTKIILNYLENPKYYLARYYDKIDDEHEGSYGSPNYRDVVYDIVNKLF